jgi:tRNA pseudouridine32 synthase / 23S rRNA pseudouridine746 synthase
VDRGNADVLSILFEDDDLLAVDKPEGLAVIPERAPGAPCVMERLEAERGGRLFVVHRIDKDVSGVLLVAKNAAAHRYLNGLFEKRQVRKTYVAVVHGRLTATQGRIAAPIRQFGSARMGVDARAGKPSLTLYRVTGALGRCTQVAAHPITGRRHQLRVHFYHLGHPIVGDLWYGPVEAQRDFPRLMLHARSVALALPDGSPAHITAPIPASYTAALGALGRGR